MAGPHDRVPEAGMLAAPPSPERSGLRRADNERPSLMVRVALAGALLAAMAGGVLLSVRAPGGLLAKTHGADRAGADPGEGPSRSAAPDRKLGVPRFVTSTAANRNAVAYSLWREARQNNSPLPRLQELFAKEPVDGVWAPAMQKVLRDRFEPAASQVVRTSAMKFRALECRTSVCRAEIEWPLDVENRLRGAGELEGKERPIDRMVHEEGPLSTMSTQEKMHQVVDGDGRVWVRNTTYLAFDEKSQDPTRHKEWLATIRTRKQSRAAQGSPAGISEGRQVQ